MRILTQLASHEMLELHEIMCSEITCAKKMQVSMSMVKDPDLKSFMEHALQSKKDMLHTYQQFYSSSVEQQ